MGVARDASKSSPVEWLFAALNSVEMASLPWSLLMFSGHTGDTPAWKLFDEFVNEVGAGGPPSSVTH